MHRTFVRIYSHGKKSVCDFVNVGHDQQLYIRTSWAVPIESAYEAMRSGLTKRNRADVLPKVLAAESVFPGHCSIFVPLPWFCEELEAQEGPEAADRLYREAIGCTFLDCHRKLLRHARGVRLEDCRSLWGGTP